MRDKIKGKPPLDLYQAVREIACRLDEVINYLNNNDPAFGDMYVRTFNGQTGDVVGVSSVNGQTGDVTVQSGGAVDSVNGKTGDVTLTGDDISLSAADNQSISGVIDTLYGPDNAPPYPVTSVNGQTGDVEISAGGGAVESVNGKTGDVTLTGNDISLSAAGGQSISSVIGTLYGPGNAPPYPVTSVNGQTGDVEISAGGGAVDSVNGKTGAVLLTAADINATAGGTVQQNIDTFSSDIEELGNEVDGKYSASNPPPYPVTSVNAQTGAVSVSKLVLTNASIDIFRNDQRTGLLFYDSSIIGTFHFNTGIENSEFYRIEQANKLNNNVTTVYTAADPPVIQRAVADGVGWLISPGWGAPNYGLLYYSTVVTPDDSGWITISWPTGITTIYTVFSYVAYSSYPATLYNITINKSSNIRAALSYGSSPWPNQNPFQIILLMHAY